jgi:hypothetical protein
MEAKDEELDALIQALSGAEPTEEDYCMLWNDCLRSHKRLLLLMSAPIVIIIIFVFVRQDPLSPGLQFTEEQIRLLRQNPPRLKRLVYRKRIVRNVDWMLDFAIIGFPKCGTSYLKQWLGSSPDVFLDDHEVDWMAQDKPYRLVEHLHQVISIYPATRIGIKFPGDIDSMFSLHYYRQHFPRTKFIVLLRHPVWWFQSFYNFRYRNVHPGAKIKKPERDRKKRRGNISNSNFHRLLYRTPEAMVGSCFLRNDVDYSCMPMVDSTCDPRKRGVCTNRAQFHHAISRLVLTNLTTKEEWELLDHHTMTLEPTLHPVLFIELDQMNARDEEVRETLKDFLGVQDLPPMPQYTPTYTKVQGEINICDDRYDDLRTLLVSHGHRASKWILEYLLRSPKAIVVSRQEFVDSLGLWKVDPCTNNINAV